jgi:hypothetical protein
MQAQRVNHQIMRPRFKIKPFVIGNDPRPWHPRPPKVRKGRDHCRLRKPSVNLDESFLNLVGGIFLQKQGRVA